MTNLLLVQEKWRDLIKRFWRDMFGPGVRTCPFSMTAICARSTLDQWDFPQKGRMKISTLLEQELTALLGLIGCGRSAQSCVGGERSGNIVKKYQIFEIMIMLCTIKYWMNKVNCYLSYHICGFNIPIRLIFMRALPTNSKIHKTGTRPWQYLNKF